MDQPNLVQAIYNFEKAETLLAHPGEDGVFVTLNHFNEIVSGNHNKTNCVYTEEQVCVEMDYSNPSFIGGMCVRWRTVKTCSCN